MANQCVTKISQELGRPALNSSSAEPILLKLQFISCEITLIVHSNLPSTYSLILFIFYSLMFYNFPQPLIFIPFWTFFSYFLMANLIPSGDFKVFCIHSSTFIR
jgi:hypothetical protein